MSRKFSRAKFRQEQHEGWRTVPAHQLREAFRQEQEAAEAKRAEARAAAGPYGAASIIVGLCSLLTVPIIVGRAAIVLGALALAHGDDRGLWGILLGLAGPIIATLIGSTIALTILAGL